MQQKPSFFCRFEVEIHQIDARIVLMATVQNQGSRKEHKPGGRLASLFLNHSGVGSEVAGKR